MRGKSRRRKTKPCSDTDGEGDEDYEVVGVERESMAKGMTTLKGRDTIIKCVLDSKQEQFTDLAGYKVLIATWNVNGQSPGSICLSEWLARTPEPPDFYAIGFQELDLSKEAFLFNETPKEAEWLTRVKEGLHKGAHYKKVKLVRLVGMMLIVYAKENLIKSLKQVHMEYVGTGILGKMGNKGGVAVRFELEETSICFVNCHLAAHVEEYQRRNQDFQQISTRLTFFLQHGIKYIKDHDLIFWFGDMNYRINPQFMDAIEAKKLIQQEKYQKVLDKDQLKDQMREGNVFVNFKEGPINFKPTYKYDPGTDNWDSSEKNRSPAWCDRILWKGDGIEQIDYTSLNAYTLSDHKPVSSLYTANVKVINPTKYRRVYEEALKKMDKLENEFLPQVTVDIPGGNLAPHSNRNEIHFGKIRFMEPIKKTFTVANTGQVPVRLEFIRKLDDLYVCKDWLRIEPLAAFIQPGETCEIELQVLVDKKSAGNLNIGKDTMYDILVLHLESGKDIFVTVIGEYERSVFGCSISALVNMIDPITSISPGKLIELEKGQMPMGVYDIPKELWFLVDRIWRMGMQKESLFTQVGLTEEILQIRDWLNVIPNTPIPGSVDSIAEALFLLLESFPEPVIPFNLHLKCLDAASSYTSCKQILKLLPAAHRNVFVYICSFLRELLANSDKNGLEPKLLALLFGRVMLHEQNWNTKPNQKVDKDKATFIYQFLVNEDYGEDL
ncbi:unnamed protein product [Allacma fusca]|uniref:phosphoinositide 5-phosphatase n=1 Tax=Allacma fusca TaxID=39272 RepID=A0A8J2PSD0_9HEXA|nr:unnamed protein product [Allacma fusca]